MVFAVTHGVRVEVKSEFLPQHSSTSARRYVFSYTVQISNESETTVQLKSRHWHILHGSGRREEVRGPGVVGEQPVIRPGEGFEYSSGCVLSAPHGTMHGSYEMVRGEGDHFQVEIPAFVLAAPHVLN
ncbi:MAG TPA: Co2+/Mg2+ efflux protein ApaG [Polyangiales bacterium]